MIGKPARGRRIQMLHDLTKWWWQCLLLHSNGQVRAEGDEDTEKGCHTTEDYIVQFIKRFWALASPKHMAEKFLNGVNLRIGAKWSCLRTAGDTETCSTTCTQYVKTGTQSSALVLMLTGGVWCVWPAVHVRGAIDSLLVLQCKKWKRKLDKSPRRRLRRRKPQLLRQSGSHFVVRVYAISKNISHSSDRF